MGNNDREHDEEGTSSSNVYCHSRKSFNLRNLYEHFLSSLSCTNEEYFRALYSIHTLLVDLTVKKEYKQIRILAYY